MPFPLHFIDLIVALLGLETLEEFGVLDFNTLELPSPVGNIEAMLIALLSLGGGR